MIPRPLSFFFNLQGLWTPQGTNALLGMKGNAVLGCFQWFLGICFLSLLSRAVLSFWAHCTISYLYRSDCYGQQISHYTQLCIIFTFKTFVLPSWKIHWWEYQTSQGQMWATPPEAASQVKANPWFSPLWLLKYDFSQLYQCLISTVHVSPSCTQRHNRDFVKRTIKFSYSMSYNNLLLHWSWNWLYQNNPL